MEYTMLNCHISIVAQNGKKTKHWLWIGHFTFLEGFVATKVIINS